MGGQREVTQFPHKHHRITTMKIFVLAFVVCALVCLSRANDEEKKKQWRDKYGKMEKIKDKCDPNGDISTEMLKEFWKGKRDTLDNLHQCFLACMLKQRKMMNEDGKLVQLKKANFPEKFCEKEEGMCERIEANLQECYENASGIENECECATSYVKCLSEKYRKKWGKK